jgi:cellulose synthase operon protein C
MRLRLLVLAALLALAPSAWADEADDQYAVAAGHYARREWKLAAEEFQTFLDRHPDDARADQSVFFLAGALVQSGRFDEARTRFAEYLRRSPSGTHARTAQFRLGEAAYFGKQYDLAKTDLEAFQRSHPNDALDAYVLPYLGDIALTKKDFSAAAKYYGEALSRFPDGAMEDDYRLGLGRALAESGKSDEAASCFETLAAKRESPLASEARLRLGVLYYDGGRYAKAVATLNVFETEKQLDEPLRSRARLAHAMSLEKLGRNDDAISLLGKVAGDEPFATTVHQLAEAAYAASDWDWAATLFAWLVDKSKRPEYVAKGLSGLGWSQFKRGQSTEAAATLDRLLQSKPEPKLVAEAAWLRGRILQQLKQFDAASAMYDLALQSVPDPRSRYFPEVLLTAARLREERHQDHQAAALYARFVKECPGRAEMDAALYEWSWTLHEIGRDKEATAALQRIHDEFPKSEYWADATCRLAQRAFESKNHAAAGKLIDALFADGAKPTIGDHALRLRWQMAAIEKRWDEVRRAAEQLANDYPQSPLCLMADFWVAEAMYRQGDYDAAGQRFDSLARRTQGRKETWMAMIPLRQAQVLAQKGEWLDAQAIASKIPADYPDFQQQYEVEYLLGRCLASRAEFDKAREAYRRVIQSDRGAKTETAAMAQWMIGETYFHQKNHEAALREYLRVEILYAYPRWQAGALLQAGKCREELGQRDAATELYRRVVQTYPNTPFAEEADRRLRGVAASPDSRQANARKPSNTPR